MKNHADNLVRFYSILNHARFPMAINLDWWRVDVTVMCVRCGAAVDIMQCTIEEMDQKYLFGVNGVFKWDTKWWAGGGQVHADVYSDLCKDCDRLRLDEWR